MNGIQDTRMRSYLRKIALLADISRLVSNGLLTRPALGHIFSGVYAALKHLDITSTRAGGPGHACFLRCGKVTDGATEPKVGLYQT